MPPGTGDVAISLSQLLPLSGAVVVCTPQDVALLDAVKAIAMFRKVNIDVLGMVENMSFFLCPNCNARHEIFGSGGARRRAAELDVPFLGEVPICIELRVAADEGKAGAAFDVPAARPYLEAIATIWSPICRPDSATIPSCRRCRCWDRGKGPGVRCQARRGNAVGVRSASWRQRRTRPYSVRHRLELRSRRPTLSL